MAHNCLGWEGAKRDTIMAAGGVPPDLVPMAADDDVIRLRSLQGYPLPIRIAPPRNPSLPRP